MKKDYISASDINKFVYCNYSYYYEKKYGTKKIRAIRYEKNYKKYGDTKKIYIENKNFKKGQKFHNKYKIKKNIYFIILKIVLILIIFSYLYFKFEKYFGGYFG